MSRSSHLSIPPTAQVRDRDRPTPPTRGCPQTAELHAWDAAHRESLTRAERAEHRSETGAPLRSLFFVRLIGGVFVVIGFGGFFFVQLR
jgi:hypothetical protein